MLYRKCADGRNSSTHEVYKRMPKGAREEKKKYQNK
jgi:hypothetical protein